MYIRYWTCPVNHKQLSQILIVSYMHMLKCICLEQNVCIFSFSHKKCMFRFSHNLSTNSYELISPIIRQYRKFERQAHGITSWIKQKNICGSLLGRESWWFHFLLPHYPRGTNLINKVFSPCIKNISKDRHLKATQYSEKML